MTFAIGIMSGTSVDAVDAVLLEIPPDGSPVLRETATRDFPAELRHTVLGLMTPGENEIDQACRVHVELGELYAEIALDLVGRAGSDAVSVIGCHGQTVRHRPDGPHPFTLQLGSGAVIAERTGIPTVTDFRSADIAAGGQGAPFATFFHRAVFSSDTSCRAIVNLGGIANVTLLPRDRSEPVTGFDTGPANCLMDLWTRRHLAKPFDESGAWAAGGAPDEHLLGQMLADHYFSRPPPKSTGREYFSGAWLDRALAGSGETVSPANVQATLAMLTARSISGQLPPAVDAMYLCGGGCANPHLRALLGEESGLPVDDTSALGWPPEWIEAAAFGWMALATLNQSPSTLPSVTGASRATIAGAIHYP